jgi:tRNA(Ile)-lysidine synthase
LRTLTLRVARTLRRAGVSGRASRVAAAVSGGADSVALARLLARLAGDGLLTLAGLIHVNHQLRGADADADEQFVAALARDLGVPCHTVSVDVAAAARARRVSVEVAGRTERYRAFEAAAEALSADLVATGHTRDDQAETVLLRLLRGAGARGLAAIRVRHGRVIRPVLDCRRAELRAYLESIGQGWCEDASNADIAFPRNRLRHSVMPVIEAFAPGSVNALARFARLAADDEEFLVAEAIKTAPRIVQADSREGIALDAGALAALPRALARRLVREIAATTGSGAALAARHLEAVCRLAASDKPQGHLDLPGLSVERRAGVLRIGPRTAVAAPAAWPERALPVPGEVEVPEAGCAVSARAASNQGEALAVEPARAQIRTAGIVLPLVVRNRRPGDRLQPLGGPGRRKLQDLFVDRKVPRDARDRVPVITDANGRILWVPGVAMAEQCRVRSAEDGVLLLELRKFR